MKGGGVLRLLADAFLPPGCECIGFRECKVQSAGRTRLSVVTDVEALRIQPVVVLRDQRLHVKPQAQMSS